MATRAAVIAVESVSFGETDIVGVTAAEVEEIIVWEDDFAGDGNALPTEDDAAMETALAAVVVTDDADTMLTDETLQAGEVGALEIVGTLVGDDTYTRLKFTVSSAMAGPVRRAALPGRKGDRVGWGRAFTPLAGSTSAVAKAEAEA